MTSAIGLLGWSPSECRSATFMDYTAGMKGYLISKGADVEPPMTPNEFLTLKEEDERRERLKASGNGK